MTGKWMGALLASVAMLAPVTVQAQDLAAGAAIVASAGPDSLADTANQSDRGDRRGGGWGGRGGGGGRGNAQAPTSQPSPQPAPQWQGRRGGGNWNGGGQASVPAPDQAPRWQGRRGGSNWNGGGQVNAPSAPTADQAPRWQGRRGGGNDNGVNWQQRDRGQPPVVAPQAPRRDPSADGWRGQRWQGDNRSAVNNRGNDNNRGRYDGRQWDRNRDGQVDNRWDRNDNGRVDRRFDRDRDGRNDRYDRYDNRRNYGRGDYGRGQWNNRWRDDRRYDWRSYRDRNASLFRLGRYYSPYNNWSYRRLSIGFSLWPLFYSDRYWINDPSYYSLPDVYGPYRWVRYYDDALLVDVQSGEVVDVINNFFW
jgi:hypothetical protein